LQKIKKRLEEKQAQLRGQIAGLTEAHPTPESAQQASQGPYDMGDAAVDLVEIEQEQSFLVSERALLTEVEQALKHIGEGTYGRCIVDGELIPEKRLEAIPWTSRCVQHEEQMEERKQGLCVLTRREGQDL